MLRGIAAVVACSLPLALACHRVDEPLSRAGGTPSVGAPTPATTVTEPLTGRCIAPTPAEPPPAVPPGPAKGCPADPDPPHPLSKATVEFPQAEKGTARVTVEIARSDAESERGLMYRTSMPEDHGMLFVMPERRVHTFWMRNTCIPLDMIFLDDDGLVVGIVENAPTLNDHTRSVPCPSTHVLEVNAGWSRRHGVRAGQRAVLPPA